MKIRNKEFLFLVVGILLIGGLVVAQNLNKTSVAQGANNVSPFDGRSLVQAAPEEVAQQALNYTQAKFPQSRNAQVVLARKVSTLDLPGLGIGNIQWLKPDYPLTLVILKGDFVLNLPQPVTPKEPQHFAYVSYVFDMINGIPCKITASPTGSKFKKALNDPSIPDQEPVINGSTSASGLEAIPVKPAPTPTDEQKQPMPPGIYAPTVNTSSKK